MDTVEPRRLRTRALQRVQEGVRGYMGNLEHMLRLLFKLSHVAILHIHISILQLLILKFAFQLFRLCDLSHCLVEVVLVY